MTAEEYDGLQDRALGKPKLKLLLFTIPWVVDWATPEEFRGIFDAAPAPFKAIWYLRRRSYARLAATAFAGISKPEVTKTSV